MVENEYQERYHRQGLIKGWDQKKLTNARVVVAGNGYLGEFVNLGLAALGIGELRIITNMKSTINSNSILKHFKEYTQYKGGEQAKICSAVLKRINPSINIIGIHSTLFNKSSVALFNNPKIIVDTTNDMNSKILCYKYSSTHKIPFICLSASETKGILNINPNEQKLARYAEFEELSQNLIVSEVIAGFAIDEIRKILLPLNERESVCTKTLCYNLIENERFGD